MIQTQYKLLWRMRIDTPRPSNFFTFRCFIEKNILPSRENTKRYGDKIQTLQAYSSRAKLHSTRVMLHNPGGSDVI